MVNGKKSACGVPECVWDIECYEVSYSIQRFLTRFFLIVLN